MYVYMYVVWRCMEASPESSKLDQLGIETDDFGDLRFSEVPINIHKKTTNVVSHEPISCFPWRLYGNAQPPWG